MSIKKEIDKLDTYHLQTAIKTNFLDAVLVNILFAAFVMLSFFVPVVSFALAFFVMAYLEVGVYGYVLQKRRGNKTDFENIFLKPNLIIKSICLKIIVYAGIMVWGLLLVVPGIIYGLNYIFAKFVFFDNPELGVSEIMEKSKKLVYGKRFTIFVMLLLFVVIALCGPSLAIGIVLLISLIVAVPVWVSTALILLFTFISVVFFAMPLFEIYLSSAYIDATEKQNKSKKTEKKVKNASK